MATLGRHLRAAALAQVLPSCAQHVQHKQQASLPQAAA